jgi:hypothetical protein
MVATVKLKTRWPTEDTAISVSYLDLHIEIDSGFQRGTKLYDKRDDYNFLIVHFQFRCSNIPAAFAYGVYSSHLIRYSRVCGSYDDFSDRGVLLTSKLL